MTETIRVRFAPSPTGDPHVGSLRTALFNWLFARHAGGRFIVRIEDTDRERLLPGSQERILASLRWLGLDIDEGPGVGGDVGPYIQSERLAFYRDHAGKLVAAGGAYECYCTAERLAQMRTEQEARKEPTHYDRLCRDLSASDREAKRRENPTPVIRLKVPEVGQIEYHDAIRGDLAFALTSIDDAVLLKSDGYPTYHLAVVVDDHLMNISHVIRGEEWLPSVPKHLLLYKLFDWTPPTFAHLSLLLNHNRSKLSKRDGAVSFQSFLDAGYLPEAMMNFLALMGWNPGGDRELLARDELVRLFSLERIQSSGAVFDTPKLDWMNLQYLKKLSGNDYSDRLVEQIARRFPDVRTRSAEWLSTLTLTVRDRIKRFGEAADLVAFAFEPPAAYEPMLLVPKKKTAAEALAGLTAARAALEKISEPDWSLLRVQAALAAAVVGVGDSASVLWPVRVAVTGRRVSPPVYESIALLARSQALERLMAASEALTRLSDKE